MAIRKTGARPNAQRLAKQAAEQLKTRSKDVDAANPALQALVVSTVEKVVAQDAFVKAGQLSAADVASLKVEVASATAKALSELGLRPPAEKAATSLRHAERILEQQAKVLGRISADAPDKLPELTPQQIASQLGGVFDAAAAAGSVLAHDLWYADALSSTVQGDKSNDLGIEVGDGRAVRARPFMAPSSVILESGDANLIATMNSLNIAGTQAALTGIVDALSQTWAKGVDAGDHFGAAKALPDPIKDAKPAPLDDAGRALLRRLGAEVVKAHESFARDQEPDWSSLPLAHAALKGSHQRWLQRLSYEPGDAQKVGFDQLSFSDKRNTVSSVVAATYGAMRAGGMLPEELTPGVPSYLERDGSARSTQLKLDQLEGKPAIVLRDTMDGRASNWALRVDGRLHEPRAIGGGDKLAAAWLQPGVNVEIVDKRTGAARVVEFPDSVLQRGADPALARKQLLGDLVTLESSLGKATTRRSDVRKRGRELLHSLAPHLSLDDARKLGSVIPGVLAEAPLALLATGDAGVAFVDAAGEVDVAQVTKANARELLDRVKTDDEKLHTDSTPLRRALLARSEGGFPTSDAYTFKVDVPRNEKWDYIDPLSSWTGERRALHERIFARGMAQATGLNEVISQPGEKPIIVAMRGNTAVGKTRTLATVDRMKEGAAFMKENGTAAINPDPIKAQLVELGQDNGVELSSHQVHEEGSAISWRLMTQLQETAMSMVIDRRLGSPNDVSDIVASAEANDKAVELIDVDAKLEFSIMGVLLREPGGTDPIVPFDAVAYGFREVREGRLKVIERVMNSDAVERYDLFATNPDGTKTCVAQKRDGEMKILDTDAFDACVGSADAAVDAARTRVIDDAFISQLTEQLPGAFRDKAKAALARYRGHNLEDALTAHASAGQAAQEASA
jgi:hypothetical protein